MMTSFTLEVSQGLLDVCRQHHKTANTTLLSKGRSLQIKSFKSAVVGRPNRRYQTKGAARLQLERQGGTGKENFMPSPKVSTKYTDKERWCYQTTPDRFKKLLSHSRDRVAPKGTARG